MYPYEGNLEVEEIRDNGGRTFDRYTVGFSERDEAADEELRYSLLIGPTGNHPQGVCMHDELPVSEDDGELVPWDEVPEPVQAAVRNEFALHRQLTA